MNSANFLSNQLPNSSILNVSKVSPQGSKDLGIMNSLQLSRQFDNSSVLYNPNNQKQFSGPGSLNQPLPLISSSQNPSAATQISLVKQAVFSQSASEVYHHDSTKSLNSITETLSRKLAGTGIAPEEKAAAVAKLGLINLTLSPSQDLYALEKLNPINYIASNCIRPQPEILLAQLADHSISSKLSLNNRDLVHPSDQTMHHVLKTPTNPNVINSPVKLNLSSNTKSTGASTQIEPQARTIGLISTPESKTQDEEKNSKSQQRSDCKGKAEKDMMGQEDLLRCENEAVQEPSKAVSCQEHNMEAEDSESDHTCDMKSETCIKLTKRTEPHKKKVRVCFNTLCITDPTDATLWCRQKVKHSNICKQCFEAYKKEQYCHFCLQIYIDNDTSAYSDGKDWIECDECGRWHHIDCEHEFGLKGLKRLLQEDKTYKYNCPACRTQDVTSNIQPIKMKKLYKARGSSRNQQQVQECWGESQTANSVVDSANKEADDSNLEEVITKKVRLSSDSGDEAYIATPQAQKEAEPPKVPQDMTKKKLDSVINRTYLSKKKLQSKIQAMSEFPSDIERLMTQYAGKRLQLSESEIRADLNLFRELSGSTCPTEEKSNSSEGHVIDYLNTMWEEKNKLEFNEEERPVPRRDPKKKLQFKILRTPKRVFGSRLDEVEDPSLNMKRRLRSCTRATANLP